MCCMTKSILRWGLVGGLVVGGLSLASPSFRHHVGAGVAQIQSTASAVMEDAIDDPVMLRRQLSQLVNEYPERIAEVQGEIAQLDAQLGELARDMEVAGRVVAMTGDDLQELKVLVARAEAKQNSNVRQVSIRFDGVRFDLNEAYAEAHRINNVRQNYQDRYAHDQHQTGFLKEQKARLNDILVNLEDEFDTAQTHLWNLEREIESIERNEKLIELTQDHQATLAEYDKLGKVTSLKQVQARLKQLRAEQEARLQQLNKTNLNDDYETRAAYDLDVQDMDFEDPFADLDNDITETEADEDAEDLDIVAFADPIVIE